MVIKQVLSFIKQSLKAELSGIRLLSGDKLDKFNDIFYLELEEDDHIYYNQFNIVLTSKLVFEKMRPYLKDDSKIMVIEIPEYNTYIYVYAYYNDHILTDYLIG